MSIANEFDLLAALLRYPGKDYWNDAAHCLEVLWENDPEAAALVEGFVEQTRSRSLEELQALFTTTFDLDPVCSLEVGWHLFGENYERGEFLVKMRGQLRRLGVAESTELPDHLTHALVALGRMELEEAADFAAACLFPALDKMGKGIEGKSNPFENVLLAVRCALEHRYPRPAPVAARVEPAFPILDSGSW
jgi:nitrate reductase delta subunit